jgi:hypothetical protein
MGGVEMQIIVLDLGNTWRLSGQVNALEPIWASWKREKPIAVAWIRIPITSL